MPKKRSFNKYNKPPSTVPASLASATAAAPKAPKDPNRPRNVNDILANLRRANIQSNGPATGPASPQSQPTVPPSIRQILQLPETPPPIPRLHARLRLDANGRRLPAGPPAPRSWEASRQAAMARSDARPDLLPQDYMPGPKTLMDMTLRTLVANWSLLRLHAGELGSPGLYRLPNRVREPLIRYLDESLRRDFTLEDFKAVMVPPEDEAAETFNEQFTHVAIPATLLTPSTFPSLINVLYPKNRTSVTSEPQDSWDSPRRASPTPSAHLLPNITHLSLAMSPGSDTPSWRHLLALSKKLSAVTHLSLAFWPEPTRSSTTTNTTTTITDPYTHSSSSSSVDSKDWAEGISIVRMLSKNLYRLEYLDLTGCTAWFPVLLGGEEEDDVVGGVDWARDWSKVGTLKMRSGVEIGDDTKAEQRARYREGIGLARRVERHITAQRRAGRGKVVVMVEKDDWYALREDRHVVPTTYP